MLSETIAAASLRLTRSFASSGTLTVRGGLRLSSFALRFGLLRRRSCWTAGGLEISVRLELRAGMLSEDSCEAEFDESSAGTRKGNVSWPASVACRRRVEEEEGRKKHLGESCTVLTVALSGPRVKL